MVETSLSDGTAAMRLYWFSPYQVKRSQAGAQISVSGKVNQYLGRLVMNNHSGGCSSSSTSALSHRSCLPLEWEHLSAAAAQADEPGGLHRAPWVHHPITGVHPPPGRLVGMPNLGIPTSPIYPISGEQLNAARQRLAFDEIFLLQLGVLRQ